MSSKRKNTPTKLPKDDVIIERPNLTTDCTFNNIRCGEINSHFPLQINSKSDSSEETQDSDSGAEKTPNKKQRILQSLQQDSDSDSESNHKGNINNCFQTKSAFGLHRKSMETVLQRLNSKSADMQESDNDTEVSGQPEQRLLESIQVLLKDGNTPNKEQRLNDMISQLQNFKDTLSKQNQV